MTLPHFRTCAAVPQHLPARAEIEKIARALDVQIAEQQTRSRRAELAWLRRDCELLGEAIREACRELHKAGFNPNEPRVPAGNPDGGQWTREGANGTEASSLSPVVSDATPDNTWTPGAQYAANDPPATGDSRNKPPEIPADEPATAQFRNAFLKSAAYFLADLLLAEEPIGWYLLGLQATEWLSEYLPWITAYLDQPKTWEELQQNALRKRPGYDIHHPVEQTPASDDGFPDGLVDGPNNRLSIPRLKHWQITGWYGKKNPEFKDDYGNSISPRQYLRGKSWEERMRVGTDALIEFGVLEP